MKLKQLILPLLFVAAGVTTVVGCYGNSEINKSGEFKCQDDGDCISGFICENQLCITQPNIDSSNKCIDKDGDGYGGPENTPAQILNCTACLTSKKKIVDEKQCIKDCKVDHPDLPDAYCKNEVCVNTDCLPDCDDNDKDVHPGALELCDGKNNSCHDERNGKDGIMHCNDYGECGPAPKASDPFNKSECENHIGRQTNGTARCYHYKKGKDKDDCRYVCRNGRYEPEDGHEDCN